MRIPLMMLFWSNDLYFFLIKKGFLPVNLYLYTVSPLVEFQGIKSDFRTSSGMFLSHQERNYPMVQVLISKKL